MVVVDHLLLEFNLVSVSYTYNITMYIEREVEVEVVCSYCTCASYITKNHKY